MKNRNRFGTICCILGAISWGLSGTCSQALFERYTVNPSWLTSMRMLSAGIILVIWMLISNRKENFKVLKSKSGMLEMILFSFGGLLLCQVAYLTAIKWTNSGTATVVQNISIVFITIFTCITAKSLPKKMDIICIILALFGVWLLATGGNPGNLVMTPMGLMWGLLSAFGATTYTLLSKSPVEKWGSISVTGIGMIMGGIVFFIAIQGWHIPEDFDLQAWMLLSVVIVVGTIGAFIFFLKGISIVGPVKATLFGCIEPLTAAVLSAVWLHSVFSFTDLIGFACILMTVVLSGREAIELKVKESI